jgi:hypothetical protein
VEQVVRAVNATTASVQQLQTDNATLGVAGLPKLRTDIAVERTRRLRLRSSFIGMGQILDVGSNDQLLWAMVDAPQLPGTPPRGVYYVRHDQFQTSAAREALPVPPQALIEAFGLVDLQPQQVVDGPYAKSPGRLEFRTQIPSFDGGSTGTKIMVVDDRYGWILEQHWYDIAGQWTGSVVSSDHRFEPQWQASLPHRLEVRLPPPRVSFEIAVEDYTVNQLLAEPGQLWNMPAYEGYRLVDLAAPPVAPAAASPGYPPPQRPLVPASAAYPEARYRPSYRGYSDRR